MIKIYLLILSLFFIPSISYLEVYIPTCARNIIPQNIQYTLSNFGYIPYGQSYVGQVFLPKAGNQQLCTTQNQPLIKSSNSKSILLVRRGTCKFTQKVLNGQKLGADQVIVYDNNTSDRPHVIMKNDGHGHLINIPSSFISKSDGLIILKALKDCNQDLFLKQNFQVFESQIVDLQLWLNLNNRQSYVLLRDFYNFDYYNVINKYVNLSVKFRIEAGCNKLICKQKDCLGENQNKYCVPTQTIQGQNQISGKQLLKQSMRMYFLFQSLTQNKLKLWFQYMILFDKNLCIQSPKDIEECSYEAMKKVGISNDLIQSIKKNITTTIKKLSANDLDTSNVLFKISQESDLKNIVFYPQAVINGKNFYGLFKAHEVFEMVCNSLLAQPKQCYSFIKNKTSNQVIDKTDDLWLTVLFIVILMILGFLVALFVYTKLIKNQVNQQISMQVNKMVENYVALSQQNSTNNSKVNL